MTAWHPSPADQHRGSSAPLAGPAVPVDVRVVHTGPQVPAHRPRSPYRDPERPKYINNHLERAPGGKVFTETAIEIAIKNLKNRHHGKSNTAPPKTPDNLRRARTPVAAGRRPQRQGLHVHK